MSTILILTPPRISGEHLMGCVTSWMYAGIFLLSVFGWPLYLADTAPLPILIFILLVNSIIAVNSWYQCSSRELSYFAGLNAISASLMSGCANITLLYLPFVLIFVYLKSIYYSILGLCCGRQYAQWRWQTPVLSFVNRSIRWTWHSLLIFDNFSKLKQILVCWMSFRLTPAATNLGC